jgi:hypothetical protein
MGWVTRGSRSYYFRSRWRDGRVETEVFSGLRAKLEAKADEEARDARRREAEEFAKEDELDAEIDRLFGKIEEITAERLHAAGYHRHKREWRRRRGGVG